jgi:CheY-like chemotaxis protein
MQEQDPNEAGARLVHRITNAVTYVVTNLALLSEEMSSSFEKAGTGSDGTVTLTRAQLRRLLQLAGDAQSGAQRTGDMLRQLRVLSYGESEEPNDDSSDDTWDEVRRDRRILVVDDEPFILASLQRALHRYDVVLAEGGAAALERLKEPGAFDLVLCDLVMPPVHGSDVYKWIKENRPTLTDRVIFMTAGAFTQEARGFLHSVRNPVLHKPFDTKTLRWAIGQALRRADG